MKKSCLFLAANMTFGLAASPATTAFATPLQPPLDRLFDVCGVAKKTLDITFMHV